jgi:hypothetical protein
MKYSCLDTIISYGLFGLSARHGNVIMNAFYFNAKLYLRSTMLLLYLLLWIQTLKGGCMVFVSFESATPAPPKAFY